MAECRICHKPIDKNKTDWIMPSRNYYYHKECYDSWKNAARPEDEDWIPMIYDLLGKEMKVSYNYFLCETQRKKFIKENKFTNKGIYFTLKYFYEIKKNPWDKGHGGIGIVPYTYKESTDYWINQENKKRGFMDAIEKQIMERSQREVIKIKKSQNNRNKAKYNLDDIGDDIDD